MPTGIPISPFLLKIRAICPLSDASYDTVALSVSIWGKRVKSIQKRDGNHTSQYETPSRISSPSFTFHLAIFPSVIVGDKAGIFIGVYSGSTSPNDDVYEKNTHIEFRVMHNKTETHMKRSILIYPIYTKTGHSFS